MKKTVLGIMALLMVPAVCAWAAYARMDHKPYAKVEIQVCDECHKAQNVPMTHHSMWVTDHRLYAEKKPNNCKDCHQLSFCTDCHYGGGLTPDLQVSNFGADYTPKSHRPDFIEIHPIKARMDPEACYRCHNAQTFCEECHEKFKSAGAPLNIISHQQSWSDMTVGAVGPMHKTFSPSQCQSCHPGGMLTQNVWSSEHAREARTNLQSCETCHPQGNVCIKCHSAVPGSGLMINPHPSGWTGTLDAQGHILSATGFAGRLQSAGGGRTCIRCHH